MNIFTIAKNLANLPWTTDSKNWPEAKKFLYGLDKPLLWAQICLLAGTLTHNFIVKIWLLIEFVNGWRRQPSKWDSELASNVLDEIRKLIDVLGKEHPRYKRLLSLWCYHAGLVYHANGDFEKASNTHQTEAGLTQNETMKKQAEYFAKRENLNAVINDRKTITFIRMRRAYDNFKTAAQDFLKQLSDSENDIRMRANVTCDKIWYRWIIDTKYPLTKEINSIEKLPENLKLAFRDGLQTIRAIKLLQKDPKKVIGISKKIHPNANIDWKGFTMIVEVQAMMKSRKPSDREAAVILKEEILNLPEKNTGGHLEKAIVQAIVFHKKY